jgi:methylenetetrahydrofolate dehydrogenase (NADP+) / methenyltetrahydrofolate cyclohydrolase
MRIDGKTIAETILLNLAETVRTLKTNSCTPTLAVILVGNDIGSLSYVKQKQKAAEQIGAKLILEHLPVTTTPEILRSTIAHYNNDPSIHGVIVQRPVPIEGSEVGDMLNSVTPAKDVDGFLPNSPFQVPVVRAVLTILENIYSNISSQGLVNIEFIPWLKAQHIVVIGRGETAGKPIASLFKKYDCTTSIIHSKTSDRKKLLKQATVIISCVGKNIFTKQMITRGAIFISVGIWRDTDNKLHGDYSEELIKNTASFYTPTPGGVGPVNVACLMHNLVDAALMSI